MNKYIACAVLSISAFMWFLDPRITSYFSDVDYYNNIKETASASNPSSMDSKESLHPHLESMFEKFYNLTIESNKVVYSKERLVDSGPNLVYSFYVDELEAVFVFRGKKENKDAIFNYLASEKFDVNHIKFEQQEEPVNFNLHLPDG